MLTSPSTAANVLFGGTCTETALGSDCWVLHGQLKDSLLPSALERDGLWAAQPLERESFEMYGRTVPIPRYVRLYSKGDLSVRVAGNDFQAVTLDGEQPAYLRRLMDDLPEEYNSVVANWYPSGHDYIGWHGDREKQIDAETAPIVSLSLGAARTFQVRDETSNRIVFDKVLADGDCVVMGGPRFQHKFKHRVPKMIAKKDGDVKKRLNLTLRRYAPGIVKKIARRG